MNATPLASFCPSFRSAPAADRCHMTPAHARTLDAILAGLAANRSVMALTGDPGTGKTVLARQVAARVGPGWRVGHLGQGAAHLVDPAAHAPRALGLAPDPCRTADATAVPALRAACRAAGGRFLLIVDEAQGLSDAGLDDLAALADGPSDTPAGLSVLLVGGTDLETRLAQPRHDALRRRIGGRLRTLPLDAGETAAYVAHRFRVPGCACHAGIEVFDGAALACLHAMSGGVPRILNHLVQGCLFEAGAAGRTTMDGPFVQSCLSAMAGDGRLGHLIAPAALRRGALAVRAGPVPGDDGAPAPVPISTPVAPVRPAPTGAQPAQEPAPATGFALSGSWRTGLAAAVTGLLVLMPQGVRQPPLDTVLPIAAQPFPEAPALGTAASDSPPAVRVAGLALPGASVRPQPRPRSRLPSRIRAEPVPDPSRLLAQALTVGAVDPERAAELYARAALWGNGRAAYYLGQIHETGEGVSPDPLRARAWYGAAAGIAGAAARLAQLGPPEASAAPDSGLGPAVSAAAPVPVRHRLYTTGQTELAWTAPAGAPVARFRVEVVDAGGDGTVQRLDTPLSAVLVDRPVREWRVRALNPDGTAGQASAWSRIAPPPR